MVAPLRRGFLVALQFKSWLIGDTATNVLRSKYMAIFAYCVTEFESVFHGLIKRQIKIPTKNKWFTVLNIKYR